MTSTAGRGARGAQEVPAGAGKLIVAGLLVRGQVSPQGGHRVAPAVVARMVVADAMPDGWRFWQDWQQAIAPDNRVEIDALSADRGRYLGYVRAVAVRSTDRDPDPPIGSIPVEYKEQPLYRIGLPEEH